MISQRIKELRAEMDISQKELSTQLFVSPQAISKWERDEATPNPEAIAKMAEIFGVSADYLLGRTDEKEKLPAGSGELKVPEGYDRLTSANRMIVDRLIADLAKSQLTQ